MSKVWFAQRLKELRVAAGMTQEEFSQKSGLARGTIADLEQGRNSPTLETAAVVATALGCSLDEFLVKPASSPKPKRGRPKKPKE